MNSVGALEFVLSAALASLTILAVIRGGRVVGRDAYWLGVAGFTLSIGGAAMLASLVRALAPIPFVIAQLVIAVMAVWLARKRRLNQLVGCSDAPAHAVGSRSKIWRELLQFTMLGVLILVLVSSAIAQALTPITGFDERMYHASRVLYWINNGSVFPYVTHNDRQIAFPFGGELFFLWPVLFLKSELAGRLTFWLAYPLTAFGVLALARQLGTTRNAALAAAVVFAATPTVLYHSVGLKPDIWFALFVVGTGYWAIRLRVATRWRLSTVLLGVFAALAVNVKPTGLALVPSVALLPWIVGMTDRRIRATGRIVAGAVVATLFSGLAVTAVGNLLRDGNALGSHAVRSIHRAELSPRQLYTHAVRVLFFLAEVPHVPSTTLRARCEELGNELIDGIGAGALLPLEEHAAWPGHFRFEVPATATKYSLGGMAWLATMILGAVVLLRQMSRSPPRFQLSPFAIVMLLDLPLFLGIAFIVRWMGGGPERFWIGPYALALPAVAVSAEWVIHRVPASAALALIGIALTVETPCRLQSVRVHQAWHAPPPPAITDEPVAEVVAYAPRDAVIVLVGSQNIRDYPLFGPRDGFRNRVVDWGQSPIVVTRFAELVRNSNATHILIENDELVAAGWAPPVATAEVVKYLEAQPDLHELPLSTHGTRLFETPAARPRLDVVAMPEHCPLIRIAAELRGRVGLEPGCWRSQSSVERLGPPEDAFLWLGSGTRDGVEFMLNCRDTMRLRIALDVSPGPSRRDQRRTIAVTQTANGEQPKQLTFDGRANVDVEIVVPRGRSRVQVAAMDEKTVDALPNGDPRCLMVGLHDVLIQPVQ